MKVKMVYLFDFKTSRIARFRTFSD